MAETTTSLTAAKASQRLERAVVGPDGVARIPLSKEALRTVEIADVDLVLRFNDGTDFVIPNGAVDAASERAPLINFSGGQESSTDLLRSAGKTAFVTAGNLRIITEEIDTRSTTAQSGEQQTAVDQINTRIETVNLSQTSSTAPSPVSKTSSTTSATSAGRGSSEGNGSGLDAPIQALKVDVPTVYRQGTKATGIENIPVTTPYVQTNYYVSDNYKLSPSGTATVPTGSQTSTSNALADHATLQTITGTSGNDTITHNSAFSPTTGIWSTTLHLDFPNFTTLTSVTLTIDGTANSVAGIDFAAGQATRTSLTTWSLVLTDSTITNGIDLVIRYNVAADGTTPNTLINLDVETIGKAGVFNFDIINNLSFLYTDATNASDFTQTTASGDPIYTLPAFGVGYQILAGAGNDTVNAGAGHDQVFGQSGDDLLYGDAGNDTLDGGTGADTLNGGTGTNTAGYTDAAASVVSSLTAGTFEAISFTTSGSGILNGGTSIQAGDAGGDLLINIQNLTGSDHNDVLIGNASANVLAGGAGDDRLEGMAGADTLSGGNGTDTASYDHAGSGIVAALTTGTFGGIAFTASSTGAIVNGGSSGTAGDAGGDTLSSIENLTGSAYGDILVGNASANTLAGGAGDDVLQGMGGADTLDGGSGTNTASYSGASNGVVASTSAGTFGTLTFSSTGSGGIYNESGIAVAGDAAGDTLLNIQNLIGSAFNDTLIATSSSAVLEGGAGSDTLISSGGTASYSTAGGNVVASLSAGSFSGVVFLDSGSGILNSGSSAYAGDAAGDLLNGIANLQGSTHNDTLVGNSAANTLSGGAGNDILEGMGGADTLDGGSGTSNTASYSGASAAVVASLSAGTFGGITFTSASGGIANGGNSTTAGDAGGDTLINLQSLTGSAYADVLVGDTGANTLNGGAGDDILQGMGGGDTIDGGTGTSNTVSYDGASAAVVSSLSAGTYSGVTFVAASGGVFNTGNTAAAGNAAGETLINIQNVLGSAHDDTLIGDSADNNLEGGAGADILNGSSGSDTASYLNASGPIIASLTTGSYGGISFTSDPTTLGIVNNGNSTTASDAGGDTLIGIENLTGSNASDILVGNSSANTLVGGAGNDTLEGGAGADILNGGTGSSDTVTYVHSASAVVASLSAGAFGGVIFTTQASTLGIVNAGDATSAGDASGDTLIAVENLTGSDGNDVLVGNSATNTLLGGAGNDTLQGMGGGDTLDGGGGTSNTASYADAGASISVSLTTGTGTAGDANGDQLFNIQNLVGSAFADTLIGDSSANSIAGGGSNDTLQGLAGGDVLDGGDGSDTVSYVSSATPVIASLSTGSFGGVTFTADSSGHGVVNSANATLAGDAAGDTLIAVENLTGSSGDDLLVGNSNGNTLLGGDGNDTLQGMAGSDTLDGGGGTSNTASYAASSNGVSVSLTTGTGTNGDADGDTLSNIQNLIGSAQADTLIGDSAVNQLSGGAGNDTLQGLAGGDVLDGGDGSNDTASYISSSVAVVASLAAGSFGGITFTTDAGSLGIVNSGDATSAGDAGGDTLIAVENLTGSSGNDVLVGSSSANTLLGGDGNDTLQGLAGADTLNGEGGTSDTVSYLDSASAVVASLTEGSFGGVVFTTSVTNGGIVNGGTALLAGDAAGDTLIAVENLTGSAGNDTLVGDSNANRLSGSSGNDSLAGLGGSDVLDGGDGTGDTANYAASGIAIVASLTAGTFGGVTFTTDATTLGIVNGGTTAQAGDAAGDLLIAIENLTGSGGDDVLIGNASANAIVAGAGDDLLQGMGGADALDGGTGINTATYANAGSSVSVSLAAGTGTLGDANGDTLTNIQNLIGSAYADTLTGDTNSNVIIGGGQADTIDAGAGSDTVSYTTAGTGITASLSTGTYNGVTFTSSGGGILNGNTAFTSDSDGDLLINVESLIGSAQADTLVGSSASNGLYGGGGDDTLLGLGGGDTLNGGTGTNTVSYAGSAAVIASLTTGTFTGTSGSVTFSLSNGGILNGGSTSTAGDAAGDLLTSIQNLTGSSNADTLIGDSATNILRGGAGDDTLQGLGGADTLDGETGVNTASYANSASAVVASLVTGTYGGVNFSAASGGGILNEGSSSTAGDAGGDTLVNIQNLIGSSAADTLIGDVNANTLNGGAGNDTLTSSDGDDIIIGGAGADLIDGGTGTDTISFAGATTRVVSSLTAGTYGSILFTSTASGIVNGGNSTSAGDAGGDTLSGIENMLGSAYNDTLIGTTGNNVLEGGAGSDTLNGLSSTDSDTVTYASATAGVVASLATGTYSAVNFTASGGGILNGGTTSTAGQASGDILIDIENLTGSAYADTLVGNSGANVLDGGLLNDILQGMEGADTLNGNTGTDTASYANASAGVVASLLTGTYGGVSFTSSGGGILNGGTSVAAGDAGGDTLIGIENLVGSAYADTLVGSTAANTLEGGAGGDTLNGGGGAGADTVTYANSSVGVVAALSAGTIAGISFTSSGGGILNNGSSVTAGDAGGDTLISIQHLTGSSLADTLVGSSSANIINGGAGTDTASYENASAAVIASLSTGTFGAINFSSSGGGILNGGSGSDASGDTLVSIENLTGSTYADTLAGDANINVLTGGSGDDTLQGMAGGDTLNGGDGNDTASYANASSGVIASLVAGSYGGASFSASGGGILNTSGSATAGDAGGDLLIGVENLTGSIYGDTLVAATGATLQGLAGDDTLYVSNAALPTSVDGGSGSDTAILSSLGTGSVSMSSVANLLSNIETLNIRADGVSTTTVFTTTDIQHIVNSGASSALTILANSGDVFSFSSVSGQTVTSASAGSGNTDYTIYSSTGSTLAVVHWQAA